jgi:hypothetical protein
MKKTLLFSSLFIFLFNAGFSQKGLGIELFYQPQKTMILGDFMIPAANIKNAPYTAMDKKFSRGMQTGIQLNYNFIDFAGIYLGFSYSTQGQAYKDYLVPFNNDESGFNYTGVLTIQQKTDLIYYKFPFGFRFNSDPAKRISYSGYIGYYIGILKQYKQETIISTDQTVTDNDHSPPEMHKEKIVTKVVAEGKTETNSGTYNDWTFTPFQNILLERPFKPGDFGISAGSGIVIRITKNFSIPLILHYEFGFNKIKNLDAKYLDTTQNQPETWNYWDYWADKDPNMKITFRNSVLGIRTGLNIHF